MERYFPADVSLRVSGEIADAQSLFPAARQLLSRAVRLKDTGLPVVRLFQPGTDGSLIQVFLHLGLKHVYVQPAPRRGAVQEQIEDEDLPSLVGYICTDMLSGVVNPGTAILLPKDLPEDPDKYAAHEFHPTASSSDLYELDYLWQDVERLGVLSDPLVSASQLQVRMPKPSMYSGAMKRVVQAIYGIGKTDKGTVDGETYHTRNHYFCSWQATDGIRRVGDHLWLVRISAEDGVLAMPLPLFECSTNGEFLQALSDIGDVDTYAVVAEFGGLPTGGTFPTGVDLTEAIAAGDVLRLMSADDLRPFYHDAAHVIDKQSLWYYCGWAFSDSGAALEAHNTCFWYSNQAAATAHVSVWATDGFDTLPIEDRMLRAEQWKVTINLSAINTNRGEWDPIGTGSATLSLVEASLMIGDPYYVDEYRYDMPFIKVPMPGTGETIGHIYYWGRTSTAAHELDYSYVREAMQDISCPMFVFYIGEALEVVRHQPRKDYLTIIRGPKAFTTGGGVYNSNFYLNPNTNEDCASVVRTGIAQARGDLFASYGTNVWETYALNENGLCIWHQNRSGGMQILTNPPIVIGTKDGQPYTQYEYYEPTLESRESTFSNYNSAEEPECWIETIIKCHYIVNYHAATTRAGRFYATSMDIRRNGRRRSIKNYDDALTMDYADAWEEEVGLVVPPFCREGYLFVRYFGGQTDYLSQAQTPLPAGVQQRGFFLGLSDGPVDFPTLPAEEVNYTNSLGARWRSVWTSMLQYQFNFGASINAGHTKCGVVANGLYRNYYAHDVALENLQGGTIPILDLDASYVGTAGGIDVTGKTAVDTTFVGSV